MGQNEDKKERSDERIKQKIQTRMGIFYQSQNRKGHLQQTMQGLPALL